MHRRRLICVALLAATILLHRASTVQARKPAFVPVAGGAFTVSMDATGARAYLVNDSIVAVLDVPGRRLLRQYTTTGISDGGPVDPTGTLLPIFGFNAAGVLDLATGAQRTLISNAGAPYAAVIARGTLYVPSFNRRGLLAVALGGGNERFITPYPTATEFSGDVATPCEAVASPDEATILMGDENHAAIHAIGTADDRVQTTYPIGFPPCRILFRDSQTAIAVNGGQGSWYDSDGRYAVVNLRDPTAPPQLGRVRGLRQLQAAAIDPSGRFLIVLYGGGSTGLGPTTTPPRIGVVDLPRRKARTRAIPRSRGFAGAVAVTPDARLVLVGTTRGVQYLRIR